MSYRVSFSSVSGEKKFEKALEDVFPSKLRLEIMKTIEALAVQPRPHGVLKLTPPLHLYDFIAHHRVRIGRYRVLYDVDDKRKIVWILALRKRDEKTYK